jgi:hypothetical protein
LPILGKDIEVKGLYGLSAVIEFMGVIFHCSRSIISVIEPTHGSVMSNRALRFQICPYIIAY